MKFEEELFRSFFRFGIGFNDFFRFIGKSRSVCVAEKSIHIHTDELVRLVEACDDVIIAVPGNRAELALTVRRSLNLA